MLVTVTSHSLRARLVELSHWIGGRAAGLGLTNYSTPEAAYAGAIQPALTLCSIFPALPLGPWADIGAGSGALGLALAILAPASHVTLIDRRERSIAFIDLVVRRMAIENARASLKDAADAPAAQFVGVVFRAIAQPSEALTLAAAHARCHIAALHTSSTVGYDRAPPPFAVAARTRSPDSGLCVSLYTRASP